MASRRFTKATSGGNVTGMLVLCAILFTISPSRGDEVPPVTETLFNVRGIRTGSSSLDASVRTDFCEDLPWLLAYEDTFDLYSYRTRASDGLVVNTKVTKIGTSRTCFGPFDFSTLTVPTRVRYEIGGEVMEGYGSCQLQAAYFLQPFLPRHLPLPNPAGVFVCTGFLTGDHIIGAQTVSTATNGQDKLEANDPNVLGFHETNFMTFRVWR